MQFVYADPGPTPSVCLLLDDDNETVVARYEGHRSWRRISRGGRWFRLAGRDMETGEHVYLPDLEDAT